MLQLKLVDETKDCTLKVQSSSILMETSTNSQASQRDNHAHLVGLQNRLVCVACLASEDREDISGLVGYDPSGGILQDGIILYGQTCQTGYLMNDVGTGPEKSAEKTIFFIFSEMAVRVPGIFTIKIRVVDLLCRGTVRVLCTAPFEVFSPKGFQGMMSSDLIDVGTTALSRHLAQNGIFLRQRGLRDSEKE